MRDRLKDLICESIQTDECIAHCNHPYCQQCDSVADHLLANGVIVPPVEPGQRLYEIVKMPKHTFISEFPMIVEPYQIIYRNIIGGYSCIPFEALGKTVFLTKEEAEKALAERSGNG